MPPVVEHPKLTALVIMQAVSSSAWDWKAALGKVNRAPIPSHRSLFKVSLKTVTLLVWLNTDHSWPWRTECWQPPIFPLLCPSDNHCCDTPVCLCLKKKKSSSSLSALLFCQAARNDVVSSQRQIWKQQVGELEQCQYHMESITDLADHGCLIPTVCLLVGCLTSQQQASVSQGQICSDNFTCCHTEIEVADQTFYLTQSQYTDTGPTSPSADPITPGAWQGSHWSANFEVTGMTRPRKNPGASRIWTWDLPLSRRTP